MDSSARSLFRLMPLALVFVVGCAASSPTPSDGNQNDNQTDNRNDNQNDNVNDNQTVTDLDAAELVLPDGGDALIVVTEDEGLGSAAYFGVDDGVSVRPTRLVANAGDDQMIVVFNLEGNVAHVTFGPLTVDFSINADDSFDATISAGDEVLFTDVNIESAAAKAAIPTRQRLTEFELIVCEAATIQSFAEQKLGELRDDVLSCL